MERRYDIYDYRKHVTGKTCDTPTPSLLHWNEFFAEVICSIFDFEGKLLLLRRPGDSEWDLCRAYVYSGETFAEALMRLLSSLFGSGISDAPTEFLRTLKRRYTFSELYEIHLPKNLLLPIPDGYELCTVDESTFASLCDRGLVAESATSSFEHRRMLALHYKTIYRSGWPRVTECDYVWEYIRDDCFNGVIALHAIQDVIGGPSVKQMEGKNFTITDKGYYWFQYAPKNEHFWLTAMFDSDLNVIQYYFDITYRNEVFWDGEASFYDLFLDIVLLPNGHQVLLDEDELLEAYQSGQIPKDMLDLAYAEHERLSTAMETKELLLRSICLTYVKRLLRRLRSTH